MKEKECGGCGEITASWKEWFFCRDCEVDFCPECYVSHQKEEEEDREMKQRRKEKMGHGDFEKKKRALCPKCDSLLRQYFSPDL